MKLSACHETLKSRARVNEWLHNNGSRDVVEFMMWNSSLVLIGFLLQEGAQQKEGKCEDAESARKF